MQPRQSRETVIPVLPNLVYCMVSFLTRLCGDAKCPGSSLRHLVSARTLAHPCIRTATDGGPTLMSERNSIIQANRGFYEAFQSLELERMEAVWLRDPRIICIHPGWRKLAGWGP